MPLSKPLAHRDETTFANKFIYKGIACLLSEESGGELHELSVLYHFYKGMEINSKSFKIRQFDEFSMGKTQKISFRERLGLLDAEEFKNHYSTALEALSFDSKVLFGDNEIDLVVEASDKTLALIECKSGQAKSTGTQTTSYMQACTQLVIEVPSRPVWFVHCYDQKRSVKLDYLWTCFDALVQLRGNQRDKAKEFIDEVLKKPWYRENSSQYKADQLIYWQNERLAPRIKKDNMFRLPSGSDYARLNSMNYLFSGYFGIEVLSIHIDRKITKDLVRGYMRKMFPETTWFDLDNRNSFWMKVFFEGLLPN